MPNLSEIYRRLGYLERRVAFLEKNANLKPSYDPDEDDSSVENDADGDPLKNLTEPIMTNKMKKIPLPLDTVELVPEAKFTLTEDMELTYHKYLKNMDCDWLFGSEALWFRKMDKLISKPLIDVAKTMNPAYWREELQHMIYALNRDKYFPEP